MGAFIKKNFVFLLAIILPVIFIIIVAISVYLPSFFLSTDYNFLYASCVDNNQMYETAKSCGSYLQKRYLIRGDKLLIEPVELEANEKNYVSRIFLYDTATDVSREIKPEEAESMTLSGLLTSPDNVAISNNWNRSTDFFPFSHSWSSYGYYLTRGKGRKKLHLLGGDERYYTPGGFRFLGWVLPARKD